MHAGKKTKKQAGRRAAAWILSTLMVLVLSIGLTGCDRGISADGSADSAATGGASTPTDSKTLRVGVRSNVNRFGYYNDDTGRFSGLEIDIAEEMASRMGYGDVEWVAVTPSDRKDTLLNDEVDCLVACYSITESREANFDFSPSYYTDASVVMVQDSSLFSTINELKGCTFGTVADANTAPQLVEKLAEIGFTDGEVLSSNEDDTDIQFDNFRILELPTYQELSDALEEGTIDAMCADGSILYSYLTDDRHELEFQISSQDYGVATQKDSALSEPVSETIQAMLNDGTIAALIDKWD